MIFTTELFRIVNNGGKTVRGYINFRKRITEQLKNKPQEVGVLLCDLSIAADKKLFLEHCEAAFEDYKRIKDTEDLLEKMMKEMEI